MIQHLEQAGMKNIRQARRFLSHHGQKKVVQSGFLPVGSQIEDDAIDHVRQDN